MTDYIDREAVLKCIEDDGYTGEYDLGYYSHNVGFQELIKEIPVADVKPIVRGEWLPNGDKPIALCDFYICSVCHTPQWQLSCFCPNCGADMRKEAPSN